jgi:hypothetical protein
MRVRFEIVIDQKTGEPSIETYFWDQHHDPPPLIRPEGKKEGGEGKEN